MSIAWEAAGASDVGRVRSGNEDSFRVDARRGIFLVADGMGGHAAGEVASSLAAETVAEALSRSLDAGAQGDAVLEALRQAVLQSHEQIVRCCAKDRRTRGMGTTLTACVLDAGGLCRIAHIGDSRLYRLRGAALEQLTHDHTWVQREVDAGRLSAAAARRHHLSHILTRVLTDDPSVPEVDILAGPVAAGDVLLLATDGLYNMVEDAAIAGILALDVPLGQRATALIDAANLAGGADNITVVLIRILPQEEVR